MGSDEAAGSHAINPKMPGFNVFSVHPHSHKLPLIPASGQFIFSYVILLFSNISNPVYIILSVAYVGCERTDLSECNVQ